MLPRLLLVSLLVLAADKAPLEPATAEKVLEAVRTSGAKAVVVNMWATWCMPCRAEFPDLMRFYRDYRERGISLLLVSADFESESDGVRQFLGEQGVDFKTYLKAQKDQPFIDGIDEKWSGALPATFVYDAKGALRHSFLSPITYDKLQAEVDAILKGG